MRIYLSIPFGSYLHLLHLLEVGVLDIVVALRAGAALGVATLRTTLCATLEALCAGAGLCATLTIHLGAGGLDSLVQCGSGRVDGVEVLGLVGILELLQSLVDGRLLVGGNLVTVVLEEVFGGEDHGVSLVELVHFLTLGLVGGGVLLGLCLHALYLVLAQAA